jgi:hypothetical protein
LTRTSKLFAVLLVLACALFSVAATATASKPKVKVTNVSQGKILDHGKAVIVVKAKQATAKVELRSGSLKLTKQKRAKLNGKRKRVRTKLTDSGREALSKCVERKLQATVTYRSRSGKKRTAKSAKRKAKLTWAPCSVGSETPKKRPYFGPKIPTPDADRCDFLDTSVCMYPFPNDYYTVDASTPTGKRINFNVDSMPKNTAGAPIDPTPYNRADGYSPGEPLMIKIDGLSSQAAFDANGLVPVTDPGQYADPEQRAVVINAATGERHPIFAELDATADGDANRVLYIRPTVNFDEGGHYIVALRDLRKANGKKLEPSLAFRSYRDRLVTGKKPIEERRAHMEDLIGKLQSAGIKRANLNVVWDFTVASEQSLAGRALEIRDDAFGRLGDANLSDLTVQGNSPSFTVTGVRDCSVAGECDDDPVPELLRIVEGTIDTPCYLNADGCPPGSKFAYDGAGEITWDPSFDAEVAFTCVIPASADDGGSADPARPSLYGHGLLGGRDEVERGSGGNIRTMADDHKMIFCATNWAGFSEEDLGQVIATLSDMSNFEAVTDRMQQGFVNFMYLGRALIHPDGLGTNPAFQVGGSSVIDDARLFYDGNSQGGIMGGALTALAPDFNRAALGVPGMNYSTLLQRSVDFDEYAELPQIGLYANYPDTLQRPLLFGVIQMLWDRGEANGFAHHMTSDPLADTPAHEVLMHLAYGDHQVANLTAEIEARTIGAPVMVPELDANRHWAVDPLFDLQSIGSYPFDGSALVYWDGGPLGFSGAIGGGTAEPPNTNVPPRETDGYGEDPHSYPRRDLQAQQQKSDFLQVNGALPGGCVGGDPCYSNGFTGAP